MTGTLHERVVIVTGASRRIAIGAAIARRAVADGPRALLGELRAAAVGSNT